MASDLPSNHGDNAQTELGADSSVNEDSAGLARSAAMETRTDSNKQEKYSKYVGVFGITASGKTAFLSSLVEKLKILGKEEEDVFRLDEWTVEFPDRSMAVEAYKTIKDLEWRHKIDPTLPGKRRDFTLSFTQWTRIPPRREKHIIKSHDISGEDFAGWQQLEHDVWEETKSQLSASAKNAKGLILLIDPLCELSDDRLQGLQDEVLSSLIRDTVRGHRKRFKKPVAIILGKVDEPSIAKNFGMSTKQQRKEAEANAGLYNQIILEQDSLGRAFIEKYLPKIWKQIKQELWRKKPSVVVYVISSTGWGFEDYEPKRPQDGRKYDTKSNDGSIDTVSPLQWKLKKGRRQVQPWRVTEPVRWMLGKFRPWVVVYWNIISGLLCLVALLMALSVILLWELPYYNALAKQEEVVLLHAEKGDFDSARSILSSMSVTDSLFYTNRCYKRLHERVQTLQEFANLDEVLRGDGFLTAVSYIRARAKQGLSARCQHECWARLSKCLSGWLEDNLKPLVIDGRWQTKNYDRIVLNACVAEKEFSSEPWAIQSHALALFRNNLIMTWEAIDRDKDLIKSEAVDYLEAVAQHRQNVAESDRPQVDDELYFVSENFRIKLLEGMQDLEKSAERTPKDLHHIADFCGQVLTKPWVTKKDQLEYWRVRLSSRAYFEDGNPSMGAKQISELEKQSSTQIDDLSMLKLKQLMQKYNIAAKMLFRKRGTFILGDNAANTSIPREVTVHSFYVDPFEVTKGEFHHFMQESGYQPQNAIDFLQDWVGNPLHPIDTKQSQSVCYLNVADAEAFARHYRKQLPTEDEWEIAAGWDDALGRLQVYPYGDQFDFSKTSIKYSNKQGASPIGCKDMAGLLWEWVRDPDGENYWLKGGCGSMIDYLNYDYIRLTTKVTYRRREDKDKRQLQFGFRCVLRVREEP